MSELLDNLNAPSSAPPKSWAEEVAEAGAAEPAQPVSAPEPAVVPEPVQEAAVEAPKPAETAQEEQDRRVPLKALQEERQKRAELERKLAMLETRVSELPQAQPKQEPEIAEPDPETDPIGALKRANERLRQIQEAEAARQHETRLNQIAYQSRQQFQAQVPDYPDAYQYAIKSRAMELAAIGTPDDAIPVILQREEMNLIETAVRNGKNPAQAIYEFAKARGFSAPAPAPAPVSVAPAPVPAAPVAPAPNPALQQAKAAVAASASAGGAPASKGELSMADIANLKGAAFDAAWDKLFNGNRSSVFRE